MLQRALEPFGRSRVFRALLGRHARGPAAILGAFRMRIDDTPEEYTATARRFPLFELRPMTEGTHRLVTTPRVRPPDRPPDGVG